MRTEPVELAMASKSAMRRDAERPRRKARLPHCSTELAGVDVIDAAFARLPRHLSGLTRLDAATDTREIHSGDIGRPLSAAVVSQLAAQLESLDRQRDQLAQLLRDIDLPPLDD